MTMVELLNTMIKVENNGDASIDFDVKNTSIDILLNDFGGFDENYLEVGREYTDSKLVHTLIKAIKEMADSEDGDYYVYYHFAQWTVCISYASEDV